MNELTTPEAVRAHYTEPHELAVAKQMPRLDRHCRQFIAAAPFIVVATSDKQGRADATPRGDAPGFVHVVDDTTIFIPDRRGNNRVDTMMNIAENPHVGVLFIVPGMNETLRVNGRAAITIDSDVLATLAVNGKPPCSAIKVAVEEVYFQCGKALVRSDLWNPQKHVPRTTFAPFGQILAEQVRISYDPGIETALEEDYRTGLY